MSENSPPAFQFYPKDFLADTLAMPLKVRGAYMTLLCYAWVNGSIPDTKMQLRQILGVSKVDLTEIQMHLRDKFVDNPEHNGTLVNPRMERERQKQSEFREARARAGRKSGEQRRNKKRTQSNSSSSSSSSKKHASPKGTSSREHPFGNDAVDDNEEVKAPTPNAVPLQKIVDLYHEHCPKLPRVKVLNEKRKRVLRARWKEDKKRQVLDWWIKYFQYIDKQPFLNGENDRGWLADIDFVSRESGMIHIIEGKYER